MIPYGYQSIFSSIISCCAFMNFKLFRLFFKLTLLFLLVLFTLSWMHFLDKYQLSYILKPLCICIYINFSVFRFYWIQVLWLFLVNIEAKLIYLNLTFEVPLNYQIKSCSNRIWIQFNFSSIMYKQLHFLSFELIKFK